MLKRFSDRTEGFKKNSDFVRRNHGYPLWWLIAFFVAAFSIVLYMILTISDSKLTAGLFSALFLGFLATSLFYIIKARNIIAATELQNALFAGAAKIATQVCIILKYDGTVVYVDPEYARKFPKLRGRGTKSFDALCDSGNLSRKDRDKLINALQEGREEDVSFTLSKTSSGDKSLALSLEPIGVYSEKEDEKPLRLAVNPITRPSGYFFLRGQQEENDKQHDLDSFKIASYSFKNKGEIDEINEEFTKILGYESAYISENKLIISDVFFDDDDAKKILNTKKDLRIITNLRSNDDSIINVFIDQMIVRDSKGKIIERRGIIIILPENEKEYVSGNSISTDDLDLVSNSPVATAILDKSGDILKSNKAFRNMASNKSGKSKKHNLLNLLKEESKNDVTNLLLNVIDNKDDGHRPIDVAIKGKNVITASLYISKITSKYNQSGMTICHLIDTTEIKNLEMRFVHSQKMQAVGQLAGGIAHDFNNLLTAMMGFCDLLLIKHPAGDKSFADIMQIKQNANRAANLVRQLLAFSRKQTLQPEIINITDTLADLSNLIGRLIGENIRLKMNHGRDLGNVRVDQGQLEQVIINLAVNARDAMNDGGILTITTTNKIINKKYKVDKDLNSPVSDETIEPGKYVLIEVEDTGCGIKEDILNSIFEPFFSTKEIGSGTGLGLSTVYGIIKQTDGYIYVSSKIGSGTKFSILLKHCADEPVKIKEDSAEKTNNSDLTGEGTILLVEDETPVRIFSNSALTGKGYTVLEAENADDAMKMIRENGASIDIIITDVVMPGMSGPDMIKEISMEHPDIKVIFISGYGEDAFVETYGQDRKFNFLSKPYSLKQLAKKVRDVLNG